MTITCDYSYHYNSVFGGAPFGSSISFAPPVGASSTQVTIVTVFSTRNTTAQTFTPGSGWVVVNTVQQQLSRTPTSTPYNEGFAGTNPEYLTVTTLVAVGSAGTTLTGSFPTGLYYELSFWRFSGVDLISPVIGNTTTKRGFVGNNTSTPVSWTTPFTDTPSVAAKGASILISYMYQGIPYSSNARYNNSWSNLLSTFPTTLPITTYHAYSITQANYTVGSSLTSLVVLREALYVPNKCEVFTGTVTDVDGVPNIELSVFSSSLPDPLSSYEIDFIADTTGNTTTPANSLLSAGPWTLGPMAVGTYVTYQISRLDGAHIDGSAVMRAKDTAFGLFWDLVVECPGLPARFQYNSIGIPATYQTRQFAVGSNSHQGR